jgi:hypothetical protein
MQTFEKWPLRGRHCQQICRGFCWHFLFSLSLVLSEGLHLHTDPIWTPGTFRFYLNLKRKKEGTFPPMNGPNSVVLGAALSDNDAFSFAFKYSPSSNTSLRRWMSKAAHLFIHLFHFQLTLIQFSWNSSFTQQCWQMYSAWLALSSVQMWSSSNVWLILYRISKKLDVDRFEGFE